MPLAPSLLVPPWTCAFPAAPELTGAQVALVDALVAHFDAAGFDLPVAEGATARAVLSVRECMFLSRETLLRFLADLSAAIKRLEECIVWRRTHKLEDVEDMARECEPESKTGKNMVLGFSQTGQPIVYFFPNRNTTPIEQRRTIHARFAARSLVFDALIGQIFTLERAADLMCDGVTNCVVIFSFAGKRQGPPSSFANARETIHFLQSYYPERLGLSYLQSVHWAIKAFVSLMWPFVDGATRRKVQFAEGAQAVRDGVLDPKALLRECGGELDMPYDHAAYWPALLETCLARRADQLERWRALPGPRVGRDERSFKVRPPAAAAEPPGHGKAFVTASAPASRASPASPVAA